MKTNQMKPIGRVVAVLMSLLLMASGLVPTNAVAIRYLSTGGAEDTRATEGDPLDANDYSSGNGGDFIIDDNINSIPTAPVTSESSGVFQFPVGRLQLLMAMDFRSGMPMLRIFTFGQVRTRPEARNER